MSSKAFVTLLTRDSYLPAALVLDASLKSSNSRYPLVVMSLDTLSHEARCILQRRDIKIVDVERLEPPPGTHTIHEADVRFTDTWTKLRAFDLVEYERVVLLDSDMLVMRNMDELLDLDLPEGFIAASHACACNPRQFSHYPADWKPENCAHTSVVHPTGITNPPIISSSSPRPYGLLNSGLVVLTPSLETSQGIKNWLLTSPMVAEYKFPDQDLLADFFRGKWKVLPWVYNALKTLKTVHEPLWRDEEVRCIHYILSDKPWQDRNGGGLYKDLHGWWWDSYDKLGSEMRTTDLEGWRYVQKFTDS